jgi:diguanylate cyclase (GGDEF)-like protein
VLLQTAQDVHSLLDLRVPLEFTVLLAIIAVLLTLCLRLDRHLKSAQQDLTVLQGQLGEAIQCLAANRRTERDLSSVVEFLGEITALMATFQRLSKTREIPQMLLDSMVRLFGPEHAVVLVRGRDSLVDPERGKNLVVAATTAAIPGLGTTSLVAMGHGQLGYAADVQQVMDEQDYAREVGAHALTTTAGPRFTVVAPMVAGGETLGVLAFARPNRNQSRGKETLGLIAQLAAMTWYNISAFQTVRNQADTDGLTGIFNKRALQDRLSELVYEARRGSTRIAVLMFDIDHFKCYNDTNGHLAGDQLLRTLARLVRDVIRQDCLFGRFGGEEFLLVMPGKDPEAALAAAENVRRAIAGYAFAFAERQPLGCVSVSGGVAAVPEDAEDSATLLRAADAALYRAKQEGRNRVLRAQSTFLDETESVVGS